MSNKLALILTCGVMVLSFSMNAHALPVLSGPAQTVAPTTTLVRDFCGLGFHRGPYGVCIRNGTVYVPPPVVVVPQYAPPPVVVPAVCPYGYYLGPYGRCLPY